MIKKDTIVSTTDGRLTLLQWLKKVEKALKDSTVTGFAATPTEDDKVVFAMTFADGSTIAADPIAVPAVLDKYIKLNAQGNLLDFGLSGAFDGGELYLDGRLVRLRSYKEGVWDNIDVEMQNTSGQYITAVRIRKNDINNIQVRVMGGGDLQVDGGATFYNSIFSISNQDPATDHPAVLELTQTGIYCPEKNITFIGNVTHQYAQVGGDANEHLLLYKSGIEILDDGYVTLYQNKEQDLTLDSFTGNGYMISVEELGDALNDVGTLKSETSKAKYQHTVTIKFDSQNVAVLTFTAMSSNSLKVTSFQNLATVFGGRRLTCSGGDSTGDRYTFLDTHKSTPNDYVVGYINSTGFHTDETLGTLTGTGLTVEDDVIIP